MKRTILIAAVTVLTGCASMFPQYQPISLSRLSTTADYEPYAAKGSATLTGQAFLTTRGGDVKKAAGRTVTLDPKTPFSEEWYEKYGKTVARFSETPTDPRFLAARRTATADADGKFKFTDLPPGTYFVRTVVTWEVGGYTPTQGGVVSDVVEIKAGETKDVILNKE